MSQRQYLLLEILSIQLLQFRWKIFSLLDLLLQPPRQSVALTLQLLVSTLSLFHLPLKYLNVHLQISVFFNQCPLVVLISLDNRLPNNFLCNEHSFTSHPYSSFHLPFSLSSWSRGMRYQWLNLSIWIQR